MKCLWFLFFCAMAAGSAASARADAIDDYVNIEMARQHVPGLALAVMRDGQLVRAQGYGFANLEHHVPVHPDTVFETGSVGMQFTAVAVMFLVEDGKLRLDDSIRKYLPEAPRSWAPITIRELMNHTSGLPATENGDIRREYTDDELLRVIYSQELNYAPGTHWSFGYTDYGVLGILINKVAGEFYVDFLTRRVFQPLGMQTARLLDDRAIVPDRAAGYQFGDHGLRNQDWVSATANSTADGSLYLSVLDYARWNASVFGRKLLASDTWNEIMQPARLASGRSYPYGFGWFMGRSAGQQVWWHSGAWQGFQSFVVHYTDDGLTLAAFANSETGDPAKIVHHVASMLEPKLAQPPGTAIEDREPQVTGRLRSLLQQIPVGKAAYDDFAFISKFEFAKEVLEWQKTLKSLGAARSIGLFGRQELGDEQLYRYRVRYDGHLLEVTLGVAPNGKVATLELTPIDDWNAPISE
jgi:CubicO group peptidase (beta-lactamase class C family)